MLTITAATTAPQLFGVNSNAEITNLCATPDKLYEAIAGNDDLIAEIEAIAEDDDSLDPQKVITAVNEYLKKVKAEIKAASNSNSNSNSNVVRGYKFAEVQNAPKEYTKVFVMTEYRCYGEMRKSRTVKGSNYRAVNIGGYYLVNNTDGSISTYPDNILTNSALVEKLLGSAFDITSDDTVDISGDNLAFNVVTETRVANTTTYLETAPEALAAAAKSTSKVVKDVNAAGQQTVLCYHTVSSEFAFRRLGTKITKSHLEMLTRNVERVSEARLKAIEDTAKEKELAQVTTQKEVALVQAKEESAAKAIELKINAVVGQADKLAEHGIDMQALLIAALSSK